MEAAAIDMEVASPLMTAFAGIGKAILEMQVKKASLEEVFIELTEDNIAECDVQEERLSEEDYLLGLEEKKE